LEVNINNNAKRVNIWLTKVESGNPELQATLKQLYKIYKAQKYLVVVYESGTENLEDLTRELLLYNRIRLQELDKAT